LQQVPHHDKYLFASAAIEYITSHTYVDMILMLALQSLYYGPAEN
jgi:hypothetical protein